MAYGKAPIAAADVGGWRQKAGIRSFEKNQLREKRKSFGGSRIGNSFTPSETPELIRLIPGSYKIARAVELPDGKFGVQTETLPYLEATMHEWWFDGDRGRKEKRDIICSAGPLFNSREHAQPCVGCKIFWNAPVGADGKRKSRVNIKELTVFSVLVYGTFVKVEQIDRNTGLVKINEKTGKPYCYWTKKNQQHPRGLEEKEGHVMHWAMGSHQFNNIRIYDALIGKSCFNCKAQDSVVRYMMICRQCKAPIVDCGTTNISPQDQDKMLEQSNECPHCKKTDYLEEICDCLACGNPRRATIWDVDINLMRTPGSQGNPSQLVITSWSQPRPVDPSYNAAPLNLSSMYAPEPLEQQAQRFDVDLKDMDLQDAKAAAETVARTRPYAG
jgi:hypothetical protein